MIGRFYFKRTVNGNLIGEFSNNFSESIQTESAEAINPTDSFEGEYISTWNEEGPVATTLTIEPKDGTNNQIFTLTWQEDGTTTFWGEGMLCDDILIGDYRDFADIPD